MILRNLMWNFFSQVDPNYFIIRPDCSYNFRHRRVLCHGSVYVKKVVYTRRQQMKKKNICKSFVNNLKTGQIPDT